jgi:hypothetical protein
MSYTSKTSKQEKKRPREAETGSNAGKFQRLTSDVETSDIEKRPKKRKQDFSVKIQEALKIHGRPGFLKEATDIPVVSGEQDRRHVLGWADFIRKYLEKALNDLGVNAQPVLVSIAAEQMNVRESELSRLSLEELTKKVATWLNSTPANLNPENSDENQAIEIIRKQAESVRTSIDSMCLDGDEKDSLKVKNTILTAFKETEAKSGLKKFANVIRKIIRKAIMNIDEKDTLGLLGLLDDVKTSTGIDLSKKEGAKAQTSYALSLVDRCRKLSGKELLNALFDIRKMPFE